MRCLLKNWPKFFKAICDKHRQKILSLLKNHQTLNASDIVKKIKLSQPTVSHHLKILTDAGVITATKKGKETFYQIAHNTINQCCSGFMETFSSDKNKN